ncbi:transmembrane 7 superfamily member 3-like [Achroia grisella]|uniref:transmembrane 7 superfamily member 3-like n=1 Tax=Achroia grisella TaxID=688607 RepID=UPI0027D23659|nr:transmembrane 7 superfamily member 3-like [Achroia grisella]
MLFNKLSIFLVFVFSAWSIQCSNITIPLNKTITKGNKQLYGDFLNINKSSMIQVKFGNVNPNVSFIVFQVHSHDYNISVCNNSCVTDSTEFSTNVGFYSSVKPSIDTYYIKNDNSVNIKLYIAVHGYLERDPIPGGCNMELPVSVSPYTLANFNKHYINVMASPAKSYDDEYCISVNSVVVKFYRMYLPERNFDANTYFEGIKNMMTLEKIQENGQEIPMTMWGMRRMISAYPGTGSVYVAVAYDAESDYYSVYSPTYTYACSPLNDDCQLLDALVSRFACAFLIFLGVFVCYFGHRFFKTEMFLFGFISGVVITYILISLMAELDFSELLGASLLSGVFFAGIWYIFWWFYGIPVIAVLLPALNLGFLVASIFYYKLPGDTRLLMNNFNFWSLFICITILVALILVCIAFVSNILCCSVLGAYAVVFAMDFYFGSNLKYILINTLRRATVPEFNWVVLAAPFEWRDALVTIIWVTLSMTGFLFQHYHNRGRPPFPPPPRGMIPRIVPVTYGTLSNEYSRPGESTQNDRPLHSERTPLFVNTMSQ